MRASVGILVCAACGNVEAKQPDAAVPIDSSSFDANEPDGLDLDANRPDANTICDTMAKFDPPVPIAELNTAGQDYFPRLTSDELELYFFAQSSSSSDYKIYRAQRSSTSQPFGVPAPVTPPSNVLP